jgi:2-hydroxy-6-oxonona-2,4-dienedioate hydrolase
MGMELTQDKTSRGLTEEDIIHIPGLHSRWVRLGSGAKAHYVTSGETGPAVILLHGGIVGSSGTAGWRFMAPFLGANGFRVYCPDMPGFGWSDTSPEHYPTHGVKSHIDFIREFADALCIDKFHLSGNSMGASNSTYFVVNHPDRVLSVAFIASPPVLTPAERIPPKDGKFTPNPAYVSPPWDGSAESMRVLMAGIIYEAKAVWPELIEMRNKAATRQKASQAARTAAMENLAKDPNYLQWTNVTQRLASMTIPMIHLYGMQDVLGPVENGFRIEDKLPNVQAFYPDECGHQGQTDQPEMFNQVFLEFFRDGKVSWKTSEWAGVSRRRAINPKLVAAPTGGFPQPDPGRYQSPEKYHAATGKKVAVRA